LVDKNLELANSQANYFDIPNAVDDFQEIMGKVDAAIVAVPHKLHYELTIPLLESGIHVLVEKPMAISFSECHEMIEVAKDNKVLLETGHFRRIQPVFQLAKKIISEQWLGKIESFTAEEGVVFSSPVASAAMFKKEQSGGGVLLDTGPHLLENLLWWFGDYENLQYWDDACGGVEADCKLELTFDGGVTGSVNFSRLRNLRNQVSVKSEKGTIEIPIGWSEDIILKYDNADYETKVSATNEYTGQGNLGYLYNELELFAAAIHGEAPYFMRASEAAATVQLIEQCYANKQVLEHEW
jgi:predicted dehydrogenase